MQHYVVDQKSLSSLASEYFHDPESFPQSIQDYLEDQLSSGLELVNVIETTPTAGTFWYVFKVVGRE